MTKTTKAIILECFLKTLKYGYILLVLCNILLLCIAIRNDNINLDIIIYILNILLVPITIIFLFIGGDEISMILQLLFIIFILCLIWTAIFSAIKKYFPQTKDIQFDHKNQFYKFVNYDMPYKNIKDIKSLLYYFAFVFPISILIYINIKYVSNIILYKEAMLLYIMLSFLFYLIIRKGINDRWKRISWSIVTHLLIYIKGILLFLGLLTLFLYYKRGNLIIKLLDFIILFGMIYIFLIMLYFIESKIKINDIDKYNKKLKLYSALYYVWSIQLLFLLFRGIYFCKELIWINILIILYLFAKTYSLDKEYKIFTQDKRFE